MNLIQLASGLAVLTASVVLFYWGTPEEGMPARIPNRWGLPVIFPIFVMCLGLVGCVLLALGIYP